tara:strand:- start:147 stop:320 length:174 start_codon:yes stop_codon:yes gene_type:complete
LSDTNYGFQFLEVLRKVMSLYTDYLSEIETRKKEGLKPKPIEDGKLLKEIILQIRRY